MKKILTSIFLILLVLTLTSCTRSETEYYEDDYFYYIDNYPSDIDGYIKIRGLTTNGEEQKYLVFPNSFNGKKTFISGSRGIVGYLSFDGEFLNTEKIFLRFGVKGVDAFSGTLHEREVKIMHMLDEFDYFDYRYSYVTYRYYLEYNARSGYIGIPAGVSYWYNYEDAPHYGYYWIDDYDNELIDFIPEDPTREGYTFKGWYKEPECINKWDFNIDIVPEKEYDENGEYVYKETKLYAKWEVN